MMGGPNRSQLNELKEAVCGLETDDDPERFEERLGKLVERPK